MRHEFRENDRVSLTIGGNGVAHVRLTRDAKLNALDAAMLEALIEAGMTLFDTAGLRAVVLAGEGRAFCAGLDLAAMSNLGTNSGRNSEANSASERGSPAAAPLTERTHGNANLFQQVALQWRKLPVPVIAAVHGVCFGGGLQIACGADIRVVHPEARLAVLELKWGIVPDMGGFALWKSQIREDVLRLLTYTNREFSGEEAVQYGFATLADPNPVARATAIAADIAARSPTAIRSAKSLFNRSVDLSFDEILSAESIEQQRLLGSRNQLEAVASQLAGRAANFVDP